MIGRNRGRQPGRPYWLTLAALALWAVTPILSRAQAASMDLTELSLEELLDVEVTLVSRHPQKLSRTPAAATVIDGDQVRRSGARALPEALRQIPGVQVARVDANKWVVTSRGFAGLFANKLLVLIDGRSVYTPMFSGVFWESQDVLLADVERIEVIRGPGGSLWGSNAVNGIINVVTKEAAGTQGTHLTLGAGSEERAFGSARFGGRLGNRGHYRVYATGHDRDRSGRAGPLEVRDGWRLARTGARLDLNLGPADLLSLEMEASYGDIGQGVTYVTSPEAPFEETRYFDAHVRAGHLKALWTRHLSPRRELIAQAYYDRYDRRELPIRGLIQTLDADFQVSTGWAAANQFVWGAGYRRTFDDYDGSFTMQLVPDKRTVHLVSAFAHAEVAPLPGALHLSAGTKVEHNSYTGLEVQPNVRLWWGPVADHGLWLAMARAVRTPSRADHDLRAMVQVVADSVLMVLTGDDDFTSEHMLALEMGYRGQLSGSLAADAATYHNRYYDLQTNELDFSRLDLTVSPPELPVGLANRARATSHGLELGLDWQIGARWRLRGSYTYLDLDVTVAEDSYDTGTEGYEGESPTHEVGARLMGDLPRGVELDLLARLVGRIDSHPIDRYLTADLRLALPLGRGSRLVVVGQNLLQAQHREIASNSSGTVPTAVQRGAYAALEWDF